MSLIILVLTVWDLQEVEEVIRDRCRQRPGPVPSPGACERGRGVAVLRFLLPCLNRSQNASPIRR